MKRLLLLALLLASCPAVWAQKTDYPLIGAQVFIEPGQTPEQIRGFFRTLRDHRMEVCRIRLFEGHMRRPDGTWDYSLYDTAFDAAAENGIRIFATLFPATSVEDIAGFRFPATQQQFEAVEEYLKNAVTHFKEKPALYAWVLQNEPGLGNGRTAMDNEFLRAKKAAWNYRKPNPTYDNGYLSLEFREDAFLRYVTDWYLKWIASQIAKYDDHNHYRHVNPHQIFDTLPEYDFRSYECFLTSLGISMHMSWHFSNFRRPQYPLGMAMMSDIIRPNAGRNPFWITELQGGNVTFSGQVPLCPTKEEIAQWLWTGISSGAEGIIFWTLNQRATGKEAGEWGMIDFQGHPSDRLTMASEVIDAVLANKTFFRDAEPAKTDVTLLYNIESFSVAGWYEGTKSGRSSGQAGRHSSAMMRSVIGAYEALSGLGASPSIRDIENFDWDPAKAPGRAVVLSDVLAISSLQWDRIRRFVEGGGTLIATGLTGYYDENAHCVMQTGFPFKEMFGGDLSEYKYVAETFDLKLDEPAVTLPAHMWKGIIRPYGARVAGRDGDDVIATVNRYGKGTAVWLPSLVELGATLSKRPEGLTVLLHHYLQEQIDAQDFGFATPRRDVLMQTLVSGRKRMTVFVNKSGKPCTVQLVNRTKLRPTRIFGDAVLEGASLSMKSEDCSVFIWE